MLFAPLVFRRFHFALVGMALWGMGMGAQESIMRAAIADMVPELLRRAWDTVFLIQVAGYSGFGQCIDGTSLRNISHYVSYYFQLRSAACLNPPAYIGQEKPG